jgi:hypothetical protein
LPAKKKSKLNIIEPIPEEEESMDVSIADYTMVGGKKKKRKKKKKKKTKTNDFDVQAMLEYANDL